MNELFRLFNNMGNIATVSKDNVLQESYVYDKLGQLTRVNSVAQNKTIVYEYDNGGNILSVKEYAYTTGTPSTLLSVGSKMVLEP